MGVDPSVALRVCWTEADGAPFTTDLRNVCLYVLREFRRLLFVLGQMVNVTAIIVVPFFDGSVCVCGKVLCHCGVVVLCVSVCGVVLAFSVCVALFCVSVCLMCVCLSSVCVFCVLYVKVLSALCSCVFVLCCQSVVSVVFVFVWHLHRCVCVGVLVAWCVQVKRMMRGIGNMLFSTYSQTPHGKIYKKT